ncbi:MAG: hypothetical protein QOH76_1445, partial [Thermoleophilaceae bacterium]|nr:hypothetical protein [Thermoleophilaceae bacterium]
SWTVRGTADGLKTLIASARASRYGSTFESSATDSFTVDAAPPAVTVAVPASASAERGIPVTWSATEQATFDVDAAIDEGPFTRWLTQATGSGASYPAAAGSRYRFRVRATDGFGNTSPYVVTPVVAVPADRPTTPPPRPGDPPVTAPSPELRITAVRRWRRRLSVRGAVARGVNGKLTATWTTRVRRRRYVARATTFAQLREYKFTLRIPRGAIRARHGVVEVRYLGADGFARQTARVTVRSG